MELVVIKDRVVGSFGINFDENGNPNEWFGVYGAGKQGIETKEHYQELKKLLEYALKNINTNLELSR